MFYYKNVDYDAWKGDLCVNGVEIDYDVRPYWVSPLNGALLYYTDWSDNRSYGTLKMFKNGTRTKIADDVHDFDLTDGGDILYLYDYSSNYYTGTLYSYNKGNPKKIDDDVIALNEQFSAIKQKREEIERLQAEYMSIDERDNHILGAASAESPAPAASAEQIPQLICPNCGSASSPSARFCRKCGQKLQE